MTPRLRISAPTPEAVEELRRALALHVDDRDYGLADHIADL